MSLLCPLPSQVVTNLLTAGHEVHLVTAATPEFVFNPEIAYPRLHIRKVEQAVLDCRAPNALTVNQFPLLEKVFLFH